MGKRGRAETETEEQDATPQQPGLLTQLRNSWLFANLMQYIYIFGKAVKIDEDFDIEVRPGSNQTALPAPRRSKSKW